MKIQTKDPGLRAASILLLRNKEVTVNQLHAIPQLKSQDHVNGAVEYLMMTFNVRKYTREISKHPILTCEEVISLVNN